MTKVKSVCGIQNNAFTMYVHTIVRRFSDILALVSLFFGVEWFIRNSIGTAQYVR